MEEKVDIVALGELLIDFTEAGHSQDGRKLFEQNPGGAPANLLTVASHFGYRTSFIGKVGNDMHGKFLKKTLQKEGINTDAIVEDPGYFTTLAFVEIGENGERNFSFASRILPLFPDRGTPERGDGLLPFFFDFPGLHFPVSLLYSI